MKVYLDNASSTCLENEVVDEMNSVIQKQYGNPSSIHFLGREARTIIEKSRKSIAKHFGVSPSEIIFTSGGTEANNMAILSAVKTFGINNVITSELEHHSVLNTIQKLKEDKITNVHYVQTDNLGHINLTHLEELLKTNESCLVSLMHANNEIGNLTSLKKTDDLCKQYNAIFHSDTVQTVGKYNINLQTTHVDFIVCSAHKFHGPKGIGFLYCSPRVMAIKPLIYGGSQERNKRGGTENIYGIAGLAKALEIAYRDLEKNHLYIMGLKKYMIKQLLAFLPGITFNGDHENKSHYAILNVGFLLKDNSSLTSDKFDMLLFNLDISGIAVSGGSACSSGSLIISHVLKAIHADENKISVRFSFSKYNTTQEIDYVIEKIKNILY